MIRPLNVLISMISVCISAFILNKLYLNFDLINSIIVVGGFTAFSNLINDIFDIKVDKINRPKKPLCSNKILQSTTFYISLIILLFSFIALLQLNENSFQFVFFIIFPILITYTPIFKSIPFLGNFLIGISLGSVFLFTEISLTGQINILWIPALLAINLTILRELIKDIEDLKGDYITGVITFPVYFGIKNSINLYLILSIIMLLWGGNIYLFQEVNKYYLPIFWGLFSPCIFITWFLIVFKKYQNYNLISTLLKIATIIGLFVILSFGL